MNDYDDDTYPEEFPLLEEDDDDEEAFEDSLEDYETDDDDDDEAAERRRRRRRWRRLWRRRRPRRRVRGRGYYRRWPLTIREIEMNDYDDDTYLEEFPLLEEDDDDDEAFEDLLEDYESDDDDDEAAERRRRRRRWRRRRPRRRARGRGYYRRRRPSRKLATKGQLKGGLTRASKDVKRNAAAIKKVNSRVNSLGSTHSKDIKKLKKELKQSRDMALFPMLLQTPPKLEVQNLEDKENITANITTDQSTVVVDPENIVSGVSLAKQDNMLPLIMMMAMGGMGGGTDNMMLPLMLMMMNQPKNT